ncbi:hypothetical protein HN51_004577 [Arachis hypogaea]
MEDLCERYFGPLFELLSHDKLGAPEIVPDYPIVFVDDLADQIAEVLNFFGVATEMLLKQYYSKDIRGGAQFPESDIVKACRRSQLKAKWEE